MEYQAIGKKKAKYQRILLAAAAVGLIVLCSVYYSIYGIIGGVLLLGGTAVSKSTVVSEQGLEVRYNLLLYKYRELWTFEEITAIHTEPIYDRAVRVLHISKDVMAKKLSFTAQDAAGVLKLAAEKNPSIYFDEVCHD